MDAISRHAYEVIIQNAASSSLCFAVRPLRAQADKRTRTSSEGTMMQYKPKSIPALHIALGGLPSKMRVEAEPDIGVSVTTVGELRKVTAWPENLVITTPQDHHPESAVKVSKASRKARCRRNSRARCQTLGRGLSKPPAGRRGHLSRMGQLD